MNLKKIIKCLSPLTMVGLLLLNAMCYRLTTSAYSITDPNHRNALPLPDKHPSIQHSKNEAYLLTTV